LTPVDLIDLSNRFGLDTTISRIKFVCQRERGHKTCGEPAQALVTGSGNLTLGRPRLWPPEDPPGYARDHGRRPDPGA
jgi:hypothetical protein